MRLALALAVLVVGSGPGRADDAQAMTLWQHSVLSAFQKARAHEADVARGDTDAVPRFPDLDAFMPLQDVRARLAGSYFADMDEVSECRQAVLQFRWGLSHTTKQVVDRA